MWMPCAVQSLKAWIDPDNIGGGESESADLMVSKQSSYQDCLYKMSSCLGTQVQITGVSRCEILSGADSCADSQCVLKLVLTIFSSVLGRWYPSL